MTTAGETTLVIPRRFWEVAVRGLLVGGDALPAEDAAAVGRVDLWEGNEQTEYLLREAGIESMPDLRTRPPFTRWLVISARSHDTSLESIWRRLKPRPSQTCLLLLIDPSNPGVCEVERWQAGERSPIDRIEITGARMLTLRPASRLYRHAGAVASRTIRSEGVPSLIGEEKTAATDALSDSDVAAISDEFRYSRLVGAIGARTVSRLRRSSVTIAGMGRTGIVLAWNLAALGVEHLRSVDADILLPHNLDAMPGLDARDIGKHKITAVAKRLRAFRPDLLASMLPARVQDGIEFLSRRSDLLVSCVDDEAARFAVSQVAVRRQMLHLDVATDIVNDEAGMTLLADIRLISPADGCAVCVGGVDNLDRALYEWNSPPAAMRAGEQRPWNQMRAGSLVTLNGIAVNLALQDWLSLLRGELRGSSWKKLIWQSGQVPRIENLVATRSENCLYCR